MGVAAIIDLHTTNRVIVSLLFAFVHVFRNGAPLLLFERLPGTRTEPET